jgi:two-component system, chemotaxis family, protein-glutamate methylesterase/glutaminase
MATRDIIAIGASAGGIKTLQQLLSKLPDDFPAAVMIVQHLHAGTPSVLDGILQRATTLPVRFASDGEPIRPRHVYIAPPDRHLLIEPDYLRVVRGPRENRHRPAVDPLFRSAAWSYGPRVVGVIVSGTLDDGASGLWAVRSCGGVTVVQDPAEASHNGMPTSALMTLNVDHVAPIESIATLLDSLARSPVNGQPAPSQRPERIGLQLAAITREADTDVEDMRKLGKPAGFSCPACHGGLWELDEDELVLYRCHIGHAFGQESLEAAQTAEVERALESAMRALEERGATARRLSSRFEQRVPELALRYANQARRVEEQAAVIRKLLRNGAGKAPND